VGTDVYKTQNFRNQWNLLLTSQNEDGSFTGPAREESTEYGAFPQENPQGTHGSKTDDEWVLFRDNYHTTLVVLLALNAVLNVEP